MGAVIGSLIVGWIVGAALIAVVVGLAFMDDFSGRGWIHKFSNVERVAMLFLWPVSLLVVVGKGLWSLMKGGSRVESSGMSRKQQREVAYIRAKAAAELEVAKAHAEYMRVIGAKIDE